MRVLCPRQMLPKGLERRSNEKIKLLLLICCFTPLWYNFNITMMHLIRESSLRFLCSCWWSDKFRVHATSRRTRSHLMEGYTDYTTAAKIKSSRTEVFIFCRVSNGAWRRAEMVSQSESRNNALRMLFWCAMMLNLITKGPLRSISWQLMDDDSKSVKVRHRGSTNSAWKRFAHFSALFMYTHM